MFPRTRRIPTGVRRLGLGVLLLLAACGEPPQPLPQSPPYQTPSGAAVPTGPSLPAVASGPPTAATLPPGPALPPGQALPHPGSLPPTQTLPANTKSPTKRPSAAARCSAEPTAAQILASVKGKPGIPTAPLKVLEGPYCAADWSFATVGLAGAGQDQDEALMVVATGKGATLTLVAAGSEVCTDPVQTGAPAGIRVLACGF